MKGLVLSIERFAIHDGPGIRTVIFLKGCPLRCKWCSTPDGQRPRPELEFFRERCIGCGKCAETCPSGAVKKSNKGIVNRRNLCMACGKCTITCPTGARIIAGKYMTVGEIMEIIESDTLFYFNSGGGITLSGGEPMMQPSFSIEILKRCRDIGIHTCMETSAYCQWSIFHEILKYVDLLYVDIKHMSHNVHKKFTGKSNKIILENIQKIAQEYPGKPVIVRVPIIPGINDDSANIIATALFVRQLNKNYKIELLPYHKLGLYRYYALSRRYPLQSLEPPSKTKLDALKTLIKSLGVKVI
ncbi:MAG: glycyl-radical enzyme activating protein [Candidatus Bathyarchaeia archaeon]